MTSAEMNKRLRKLLGETYGGPSISFEEGRFVLYTWTDGPVGTTILAEGATLLELLTNVKT
jgi:hypothetical protein